MKIDVKKNSKNSIISGIINKFITIMISFIARAIIINKVGLDFSGIKSLFNSIIQMLNLLDFGLNETLIYSLYKPIAEDDERTIRKIISISKVAYSLFGLLILVAGLCMTPFLPIIIKNINYINLNCYLIYALVLLDLVASYFFGAYKSIILKGYQRYDVLNYANTFISLLFNIFGIAVLLLTHNIYIYLFLSIAFTVMNNMFISRYVGKRYSNYLVNEIRDFSILDDYKKVTFGLCIRKICEFTKTSLDNIYISLFMNVAFIAIYNNYLIIFNGITSLLNLVSGSLLAGIGNRIQTESIEKNHLELMRINSIYMTFSAWASSFLLCMSQPFIEIFFGKGCLLELPSLFLLVISFYIQKSGNIQWVYTEANGLFWENKLRYVLESIMHLVTGLLFIKKYGINGSILANCLCVFVFGCIYSPWILYKYYFNKGAKEYFNLLFYDLIKFLLSIFVIYHICSFFAFSGLKKLFINFLICLFAFPILYSLLSIKDKTYKESICWAKEQMRK